MNELIKLEEFRLALNTKKSPNSKPDWVYKTKEGEWFLKGPIPLWWVVEAGALPGRALQVGMNVWFLAGVRRAHTSLTFNLSQNCFRLSRDAARRGLGALEKAGLVKVDRKSGKSPLVTIILDQPKDAVTPINFKNQQMEDPI